MKSSEILDSLDIMIPNPVCELNYNTDYELLIAIVLSAHSTDKRVNVATEILWQKYDLPSLAQAKKNDIENIIRPVGTQVRKSQYIIDIAKKIIKDNNGVVPVDRVYLESLPGVGHKTANVFLSELYDYPLIAVDTHVSRVSKRLDLVNENDSIEKIEKKLMELFPEDKWSSLHLQLVLFGRYICKAKKPLCEECKFYGKCKQTKILFV